jgi:hypothetical protein
MKHPEACDVVRRKLIEIYRRHFGLDVAVHLKLYPDRWLSVRAVYIILDASIYKMFIPDYPPDLCVIVGIEQYLSAIADEAGPIELREIEQRLVDALNPHHGGIDD